jgi:hypothetical protein
MGAYQYKSDSPSMSHTLNLRTKGRISTEGRLKPPFMTKGIEIRDLTVGTGGEATKESIVVANVKEFYSGEMK